MTGLVSLWKEHDGIGAAGPRFEYDSGLAKAEQVTSGAPASVYPCVM